MRNITTISLLCATLLASFGAQAAETTELKVIGTIRPAACTPNFNGGGTINYGTIGVSSLKSDANNALNPMTLGFTVTCDAAAKISVGVIDNRATTVVKGVTTSTNDDYSYGLGAIDGKNIGAYWLRIVSSKMTADGASTRLIYKMDGNTDWKDSDQGYFYPSKNEVKSFAQSGTLVPAAYKTYAGEVEVKAFITKTADLPTSKDIPLDGSATMEVKYL